MGGGSFADAAINRNVLSYKYFLSRDALHFSGFVTKFTF